MNRLRLTVIACSSLRPELEMLAAEAKTAVTFRHLEMGLHERSASALHDALQGEIDEAADCDAVAIGYGLCNRGIVGLTARRLPVVVPRAHDCIGMLLGGSQRYLAQLETQPGTYFESAGWLEHSQAGGDVRQPNFTFGPNSNVTRERLIDRGLLRQVPSPGRLNWDEPLPRLLKRGTAQQLLDAEREERGR